MVRCCSGQSGDQPVVKGGETFRKTDDPLEIIAERDCVEAKGPGRKPAHPEHCNPVV